jgi:hypothetical protein
MFPEFAALLFAARDFGHRAHLRTESYAAHMALGFFYEEITELVDKLVECYQGIAGPVDLPFVDIPLPLPDASAYIAKQFEIIQNTRKAAVAGIVGPSHLENIIDEIEGVYTQTLYRLNQLS